jgi:ribonucleotide monophosphatase NagD (HAD superfamily)
MDQRPLKSLISQSVIGDTTFSDILSAAADLWDTALATSGATRFIYVKSHDASSGMLAEDGG